MRATIGPLHRRVVTIRALKIAHAMRVHDPLVHFQLLLRAKDGAAELALQRQIDVTIAIVGS